MACTIADAGDWRRLWDGQTGSCLACLREHTQPVYSLAFSPDGSLLASGSFDQALHVWRTSDGACLRTFTGVLQPSPSAAVLAAALDERSGGRRPVDAWHRRQQAAMCTTLSRALRSTAHGVDSPP